jgi:hypothetical protein
MLQWFWRKKPMTWREELALEEKMRKKEEQNAKKKADNEANLKKKQEAKKTRLKLVAAKVGRNGLTWAEKEAGKKNMDSVRITVAN